MTSGQIQGLSSFPLSPSFSLVLLLLSHQSSSSVEKDELWDTGLPSLCGSWTASKEEQHPVFSEEASNWLFVQTAKSPLIYTNHFGDKMLTKLRFRRLF